LVLSAFLLLIGVVSLIRGYEQVYREGDNILELPDGSQTDILYASVALLTHLACVLGKNLRILSWAMIAYIAWWSFGTTKYYLHDMYYVMGRDGCLPCDEQNTGLYLYTTLYALACVCWVLIFRRPLASRWWVKGAVFLFLWLIVGALVAAQDG
jgi:hypothetical protein